VEKLTAVKNDLIENFALSDKILEPIFSYLSDFILLNSPFGSEADVVLDLGGGTGLWLSKMMRRGFRRGILVEPEPDALRFSQTKPDWVGKKVFFIRAVAERLPLRDSCVDLVVSRNSMHLWDDLSKGWREIFRILKPRGVAFVGRGFGPSLPDSIRQDVKMKRKKLYQSVCNSGEEPDSPLSDQVVEITRAVGFSETKIVPDSKSYWIIGKK